MRFGIATPADAARIATLRNAVAGRLTASFGHGHWSGCVTEKGVLRGIRTSRVLMALRGRSLLGTLTLVTKKPWAIDVSYFTPVKRALYLIDLAVAPDGQRQGVGRRLLEQAALEARAFPAEALRLDAYDAAAGAGEFYVRCGFREAGRVTYRGVPLVYYERLISPGEAARPRRRP